MEIKKGTWRIAILLPKLNIAIKFPRIYLKDAYWMSKPWLNRKEAYSYFQQQIFNRTVFSEGEIKFWLFRGLIENFSEFVFYQKTRHQFCLPTYFSLFGLFNIQQLGQELRISDRDLLYQMVMPTHNEARGHHYKNPANFSYINGKLQILDYGDPRVQKVIIVFGNLLQEKFDINVKCPHNGVISGL